MNKKYIKYINYIVNDIQLPYFKSLDAYGLKQDEIELVLNKVFNQTLRFDNEGVLKIADDGSIITTRGNYVYNEQGNKLYYENSDGNWYKGEYNEQGHQIYYEDSKGNWVKYEYDNQGDEIYIEDSDGRIIDKR